MSDTNLSKALMPAAWAPQLIVFGATIGVIFMRMSYSDERNDEANKMLRETMTAGQAATQEDFREVKDELRRMGSEYVSVRQMSSWLELAQMTTSAWVADFRAKNPSIQIGDLKWPLLPR